LFCFFIIINANLMNRDVLAAGGVDYALRHHEKNEDQKHPGKNHDHKLRDAAIGGGVGLGLHEHDKHKREKASNEEAARHEQAMANTAAPTANHQTHFNNSTAAAGTTGATGAGVAGATGAGVAGVTGAGVNGTGAGIGANHQPSNSHARSLKTKGKMDSFFGGLICSHSMKMRGIQRQQAANQEYKQVAHLRESERLQAQANAHARAAGVA
jgi:hypothetical protein